MSGNYDKFGAPSLNIEIFNKPVDAVMQDTEVGRIMRMVSPPVGAMLKALDEMPRTPAWLVKNHDADADRMWRMANYAGLVEPGRGWFGKLKLWSLTDKGRRYYRVWSDEMERRRRTSTRGPSWLEGEEPQPGDTVITSGDIHANITRGGGMAPSLPAGMSSGLRIVPHNRRAVDVPYEEPADMVAALGLLEEGNPVSIQYLVGANPAEGATDERMVAILEILEGRGCAVREGHGWVRTPMGTRWHQTWSGAPGSQT